MATDYFEIKFRAVNCIVEMQREENCFSARLLHPFMTSKFKFRNESHYSSDSAIDNIISAVCFELNFYFELYYNFDYYKAKTLKYEIFRSIFEQNLLPDEKRVIGESLASDFFLSEFGLVPRFYRMDLFFTITESSNQEDFQDMFRVMWDRTFFAYPFIKHNSVNATDYMPELYDFELRKN